MACCHTLDFPTTNAGWHQWTLLRLATSRIICICENHNLQWFQIIAFPADQFLVFRWVDVAHQVVKFEIILFRPLGDVSCWHVDAPQEIKSSNSSCVARLVGAMQILDVDGVECGKRLLKGAIPEKPRKLGVVPREGKMVMKMSRKLFLVLAKYMDMGVAPKTRDQPSLLRRWTAELSSSYISSVFSPLGATAGWSLASSGRDGVGTFFKTTSFPTISRYFGRFVQGNFPCHM